MSDSEEKKEKIEPVAIILKNIDGGVRTALRGSGGKFVKKPRAMPSAQEVTRTFRNMANELTESTDQKTGKISRKSNAARAFDYMLRASRGQVDDDPKKIMAAVSAFKEWTLRAYGKPSVSDEEKEALKYAGIKTVVINMPDLINPDVVTEVPAIPTRPSFIEAEIVETKKE